VFCGSLSASGLKVDFHDGQLRIITEGTVNKLVDAVEHITFSGEQAMQRGQEVYLVTERAVFHLTTGGWIVDEIAPGIDVERDLRRLCEFEIDVDDAAQMSSDLFKAV